jgi:nucleoside-diphosphate-sugar epimerase
MTLTLITGVPGWIGTRLVRTLRDGSAVLPEGARPDQFYPIRCLVLPETDISTLGLPSDLEIVRGDLRNFEQVKSFCQGAEGATLIHCAGVIHPRLWVREFYEVNVTGIANLLQAAEKSGIQRVVALSSNSPMGNNPQRDHRFDENSPYHPYQNYGHSKMQMELKIKEYQQRGFLETVILRPTWFYGPDQPARQTTFFRMIKNGKAPIAGDGGNLRSMVYVDNLCQAILLSLSNPQANGQTYWVADKQPYTMVEIIDTVERLMEAEFGLPVAHRRLRLPSLACEFAGFADSIIQMMGLYQQKVHVLSEMNKTIACSIEKAQKELGYEPSVALEEGMRRSLAWCINHGIVI